ncbi:phage tail protein [Sphingomonas sp. OK281]|uniref:phage tail protein n=1 Tax=Sphingomonas sp. OK281 TaxID=1881067 RepID=UPI0008F0B63C|nr:tail fiber protein [Sphingomonas sp. OK281]SFO48481.1 Microcystin-dependent protein [Sphingomonas sp. OK281]
MSDPFIGEIKLVGFDFPPRGYAYCNGQTMQIRQNAALYAILGVQFGGDGQNTFNLPNLAGSVAMGPGNGPGLTPRRIGDVVGTPTVTLTTAQIPAHIHQLNGASLNPQNPAQNVATPDGKAMYGISNPGPAYVLTPTPDIPMSPEAISVAGGGEAHKNMHPFQTINFVIALQGVFPARN